MSAAQKRNEMFKAKLREAEERLKRVQGRHDEQIRLTKVEHTWRLDNQTRINKCLQEKLKTIEQGIQKTKKEIEKTKKTIVVMKKKASKDEKDLKVVKESVKGEMKKVNSLKKEVGVKRKELLAAREVLLKAQEEKRGGLMAWRACEICAEEFTKTLKHCPRVLDCGHTLCANCIKTLIENDKVVCPFDREPTSVKKTAVDCLQKNLLALNM